MLDNPAAHAGGDPHTGTQRTPPNAPAHHKRNNRNRKPNNVYASQQQHDGAVSDGALVNSTASPRSKKARKPRQASSQGVEHAQHNSSSPRVDVPSKPRPVSMGHNLVPATPGREQAYAGPTFQASPAPSSLPVPKFLPRPVSSPMGENRTLSPSAEVKERSGSNNSTPLGSPSPSIPKVGRQSFPLEALFAADRAEREKSRGASSSFSPEAAMRSLHQNPRTESPVLASGQNTFIPGLDGEEPESPSRRPQQARGSSQAFNGSRHPKPVSQDVDDDDEQQRQVRTKSLKELLFNAANIPSPSPAQQPRPGRALNGRPFDPLADMPSLHQANPNSSSPFNSPGHPGGYSLYNEHRNQSPLSKAVPGGYRPPHSAPPHAMNAGNQTHAFPFQGQQLPNPNNQHRWAGSYAEHQMHPPPHGPMPSSPFNAHGQPGVPNSVTSNSQHFASNAESANFPRTEAARDIRSMEDDLRRMLKLNL